MNPEIMTIRNNEDFLGYVTALQRIQAIQQEYIRRQVEEYGRARDEMDEAKAYIGGRTILMDANLSYKDSEPCSCERCISYCDRPGWPTPNEAMALIAAGFRPRLMLDWWVGDGPDGGNIYLLSPAIRGYEGQKAPFIPNGRCTFLDRNQQCELHKLKLKPLECRVSHHTLESGGHIPPHEAIAMSWNTPDNQKIALEISEGGMIVEQVELWSFDPPRKLNGSGELSVGDNGLPTLRHNVPQISCTYRPWTFPAVWELQQAEPDTGILLESWRTIMKMQWEIAQAQREAEEAGGK